MRSWKLCVAALLGTLQLAPVAQAAEPLYYSREVFGTPEGAALMRSDLSGTFETRIPLNFPDCGTLGSPCNFDDHLAVSPDGRTLILRKGPDLWLVNSDGSNLRRITQARLNTDNQMLEYYGDPEFSPDGQKILMTFVDVSEPYGTSGYGKSRIEEMSTTGSDRRVLINWSGYNAEYSPNGTQIAFSASRDLQGNYLDGETLWVANADGSAPRQLTFRSPATSEPNAYDPAWAPSGDVIAFRGDEHELWTIRPDGTGKTLMSILTDEPVQKAGPAWSPDGTTIVYSNGYEVHKVGASGIGDQRLFVADGSWRADHGLRQVKPTFTPFIPSDAAVLAQYKPEIRYDAFETYRADNPGVITDSYTSGTDGHSNTLKRSTGAILAVSDPANRADDLKLAYLGPIYGGKKPTSAVDTDLIDAAGSSNDQYAADAMRMHTNPAYANQLTGRVVRYPDGTRVLQYWFFYYFNPKTYGTRGVHEGDWEMIQVHLDAAAEPVRATYAQHGGGERCDWIHVQRNGNGQPIVYVAQGSHASYFSAGYHFNTVADDTAGGEKSVTNPGIIDVTANAPSWLSWPGRWGGTSGKIVKDPDSPRGPRFQPGDPWNNPITWSNGVDGCTEGQTQPLTGASRRPKTRRAPARPAAPNVTAVRRGGKVDIRVRVTSVGTGVWREPYAALTSVASSDRRVPPLTRHTRITGDSLVVRQAAAPGAGPHTVRVSLVSRRGSRSRTVDVQVR